ncbi:hypothetical protein [Algisphaera agarilytica]|uniref:Chromosome segregation ATPase n=1 Tax=Algisphaera agarilytica TaxID=1385975 RepID=A0A7X0LK12_9BACT|nr:hypothetical protein [Algisphaera agarilytica]MBB6429344.1 chromosome segregation ATPase [Algisphaera agarilytica]
MPRRTLKKKTAEPVAAVPAEAPAVPTPPMTDGAALMADLEQHCVSLQNWHKSATATLETREQQLNDHAEQLATRQEAMARTHAQLNAELEQLAQAQSQVENDRAEVAEMRSELEAEWTALRNLRDAQAKLGRELDAERQRLNRRAFKITTPAVGQSPKLKAA